MSTRIRPGDVVHSLAFGWGTVLTMPGRCIDGVTHRCIVLFDCGERSCDPANLRGRLSAEAAKRQGVTS